MAKKRDGGMRARRITGDVVTYNICTIPWSIMIRP